MGEELWSWWSSEVGRSSAKAGCAPGAFGPEREAFGQAGEADRWFLGYSRARSGRSAELEAGREMTAAEREQGHPRQPH